MPANKESTESKENQLLPVYTLLKNTTNFQKATLSNPTSYILKSKTIKNQGWRANQIGAFLLLL